MHKRCYCLQPPVAFSIKKKNTPPLRRVARAPFETTTKWLDLMVRRFNFAYWIDRSAGSAQSSFTEREREKEKKRVEREKESKMITLDGHLTRPVVWYWRGSGQRVIRERAPSECVSVCSLKCVCLCVWIRACVCVERGNGKRGCKTLKSDVIRGAGQSSYWRAGTSYPLGPAFRQVCVDCS